MMKNESFEVFLYNGRMKMADLILSNYLLLPVLSRFGIKLGFGEMCVSEVCERFGVSVSLFLAVCNLYTFDEYLPEKDQLTEIDIDALTGYLQRSHSYYALNKMVAIEERLDRMGEWCEEKHHRIVRSFFDEYKNEVMRHFRYEEEVVFPYIKGLIHGVAQRNFHIVQYEENHGNIDDKLNDLKSIIIKYLPESCSSEQRNEVLFEIFLLEDDLNKHTLIEDRVLIPLVQQIEKSHG